VLPADGRHLAFPDVDRADGFYVKGASSPSRSSWVTTSSPAGFAGGSMLISRLCPSDYHRFHFPVAGIPGEARLVKGKLYSVSPIALRRNILYLVRNKRFVTTLRVAGSGPWRWSRSGPPTWGASSRSFVPGGRSKGEEKGMFAFGGSCVITLFQKGPDHVSTPDIVAQSAGNIETYARMGDRLGIAGRLIPAGASAGGLVVRVLCPLPGGGHLRLGAAPRVRRRVAKVVTAAALSGAVDSGRARTFPSRAPAMRFTAAMKSARRS
jgi:phosphatidylserine decarboxylase